MTAIVPWQFYDQREERGLFKKSSGTFMGSQRIGEEAPKEEEGRIKGKTATKKIQAGVCNPGSPQSHNGGSSFKEEPGSLWSSAAK